MGPAHLILLMTVVMCCMMNSNGEIANKAHKNEVQNERRKIVKLLMRNFPLQESSSYHNLVEDDEVGQPKFQEGDHLTKYAPSYPYEGKSMIKNKKNAIIYYRPKVKASKKPIADLSKFEYALSTILLPPPIHTSPINDDNADEFYAPDMNHMSLTQPINEATEDNTDEYYAAYMQNMYKTYNEKNMKLTQPDSEQNSADQYYLPVMQYEQPEVLPKNAADQYYLPNNQYAQQQQDHWLQYYQPQSDMELAPSNDELPKLIDGGLYDGPVDMPENEKRAESDEHQELPTLGFGNQFPGPASADNEIFDIPRILLKYQQ